MRAVNINFFEAIVMYHIRLLGPVEVVPSWRQLSYQRVLFHSHNTPLRLIG